MDVRSNKIKSSKIEIDIVLETVIEMIVKGYTRTQIILHFQESAGINPKSERSTDYYITKAKLEIKKRYKPDSEKLTALAAMRYEDLYKKNYAIQDYRECRQVLDSFNKMAGLYQKDNEQKKDIIQIHIDSNDAKLGE